MDEINVSVLVVFVCFSGKCEKCHGNQTLGGKWMDAVLSKERKRCAQSLPRCLDAENAHVHVCSLNCDSGLRRMRMRLCVREGGR